MSTLKVIIPSHLRPDRVLAHKAIMHDGICVPESQVESYQDANPGHKIISHPDSVRGLAAKREWIYEEFGDVMMIDDDVTGLCPRYLPYKGSRPYKPEHARAIVEATYEMAKRINVYLFGFSFDVKPMIFRPYKPFAMSGYINGCGLGIRAGSGLHFGSKNGITATEDFFVSAMNASIHRRVFMDLRFGLSQKDTFCNPGGQGAFRTQQTEHADNKILKRMFGDAVQPKQNSHFDGQKPREASRKLILPF